MRKDKYFFKNFKKSKNPTRELSAGHSSRQLHVKGVGLSTQLGKVPELPQKLQASPPTRTPTVSDQSLWRREQQT